MNNVKKIAIVGAGSAGLICALILKKRLNVEIDLIYSGKIGIIGVGEGSTEHFGDFINFVGITPKEIIQECNATYKAGIMFDGWTETPYLHSVNVGYSKKYSQYHNVYAKLISEKNQKITNGSIWENKISTDFLNNLDNLPFNQFHFNTFKLNELLIKKAKENNINIIDDEIEDVFLNEKGEIYSLKGKINSYFHDFYIDCTGFKRILISKLGAKWNSYSEFLKMNSAIVFQTEDEPNYNVWTLSKALSAGWLFRIPVWGRYGNGYIFDQNFISVEDAKKEVSQLFGCEINFGKQFNFDPGALEKVWIKNCVAIGLSGSFVEPLEATSIGTSIQQSFLLMHRLQNYNETVIESYNKSFNDIMENIRDFIFLHYLTKKNDTPFWKKVSKIKIPKSLKNKLELWKNKLPINEDFKDSSDYKLFWSENFIVVMHGLEMFDSNVVKQELKRFHDNIMIDATTTLNEIQNLENSQKYITHKDFLTIIRNIK